MPLSRQPWTFGTQAIARAERHIGNRAMKSITSAMAEGDALGFNFTCFVKQAQLYFACVTRRDGNMHMPVLGMNTQGQGWSGGNNLWHG